MSLALILFCSSLPTPPPAMIRIFKIASDMERNVGVYSPFDYSVKIQSHAVKLIDNKNLFKTYGAILKTFLGWKIKDA